jgi:hypothetical protein
MFEHKHILLFSLLFTFLNILSAEEDRGILSKALISDSANQGYGLDLRGWVSAGYTWNTSSNDNGNNGPISFNDRAEKLQMDQLYLIAEKSIVNEGWGLGGRLDLM